MIKVREEEWWLGIKRIKTVKIVSLFNVFDIKIKTIRHDLKSKQKKNNPHKKEVETTYRYVGRG